MGDPAPKDVVIAVLGASAGIGGLVLVFLGQVIANYESVRGDASAKVKERAKAPGLPTVAVFAVCLASVGMSVAWLAAPGGDLLYHVVVWFFVAELIAVFALAAWVSWKALS